jgi:chitin synthase
MTSNSFPGNVPQYAQQSLPSLPAHLQSDTHLTAHLASRFHAHLPIASLSSHALISLNTYTDSSRGPDGGKDGSAQSAAEDLAMRAWTRLGHRSENQAVVFLGESGSGKTTIRAHLITAFLNYSHTPLSQKVSHAAFLFDTFTTTKSLTTPRASKAGLLFELQYDTATSLRPTLLGAKILDHRLERSRVASVPTGERNFHVLYYLLAGTSAAEKKHLGLDTIGAASTAAGNRASLNNGQKRWRYLGHPTQLKVGMDDAGGFQTFKTSLRKLEFTKNDIAEICQVLASILHIGQLEFETGQSTTPAADESGGYANEGGEAITIVKNKDTLAIVAQFLGVLPEDLEQSLRYKTKTIYRERVTVMLDPKGARANADELARTLYSLLVAYVMEQINSRICALEDQVANTISILDFPGFAPTSSTGSSLDQLLNNAANESHFNFCLQSFFGRRAEDMEAEDINVPMTEYFDNSEVVKGLLKPGNGLLGILDDQTRRGKTDMQFLEAIRKRFDGKNTAILPGSSTIIQPGSNFATQNMAANFTVRHFAGDVDYSVEGLMEENAEIISGDMMNLIKSTQSGFIRDLFGQDALNTVTHPKEKTAIVQASVSSKPMRMPSMARRKMDKSGRPGRNRGVFDDDATSDADSQSGSGKKSPKQQGAAGQFLTSLNNINRSLNQQSVNPYFIFCLKPNDRKIANQFDSKCVRTQVQAFGIAEISQRVRNADFGVFLPFAEFLGLAESEAAILGSERERAEAVLSSKQWRENEARVGTTGVFLSERCWLEIANIENINLPARNLSNEDDGDNPLNAGGTRSFGDSRVGLLAPSPGGLYHDDKGGSYFGSRDIDARSEAPSAFTGDMFHGLDATKPINEKGHQDDLQEVEVIPTSSSRKRWLFIVYFMTWFIPDLLIKWIGKMKRKDVRTAWREKLAINMLIWLSCGFVVFLMVGFPELICPTQHVYSTAEISSYDGKKGHSAFVAVRGIVYDLGAFMPAHYPKIIPRKDLEKYAGVDATNLFPVQVSALCNGPNGQGVNPAVQLDYKNTNYTNSNIMIRVNDPNAKYHDFRDFQNDTRPDWWYEQQTYLKANYMKGRVGYSPQYLKTLAKKGNNIAYMDGSVYDLTNYIIGGRTLQYKKGQEPSDDEPLPDRNFLDTSVVDIFQAQSGKDISQYWEKIDPGVRQNMKVCLDRLFYVGALDTRNSTKCLFAKYLLLAISILLVSVIGFKFLAALQFGKKNIPETIDKFIICTVPAYTEDEDSLRRAIDSAARMKYDDKRKLLVIICDGMIIGQGNDKPTPRIVLDILGVPENTDPEPLSFESLGEGQRQHNMGKCYSGLYEVQGHIVPFLVVVKVGKPSEVSKPGNRGKRDSQVIMMRFLNRVHYNLPMSPLELEMHHQIRNIIGVNPTFYEFLLQIDADTVVAPDSATRFVASFLHDTRLIGICGETSLTNAKSSFITMMQVYEYYISHNLTKAFESLFGSVTCLPGCFTMYRIRAAETGKPLFVSKEVVEAYSQIRVDTLHMKNLLHLGEDRYLTTLLLKFHSKYKTKYLFRAHAWTVAPDSWTVFMSQRRRWINSTVHNLIELIPLQQLCGFCCFSMRFVVFLDLLSTLVQPVIVGYIAYLIYLLITASDIVPVMAFILLGAIYGLQAIIFIMRRKWEMIGWMIIYILATPVFAFGLPLYAFWHMDDFSWGNTRIVTGEKGQKIVLTDEGKFDPASIPKKKWEEFQAEMWEQHTIRDDRSEISGISYGTKRYMTGTGSVAGSDYGVIPPSRPMSHLDLPRFGNTSRMSLAPSNYNGFDNVEMTDLSLPSDDALLAEIRDILSRADLMQVTKKSVKAELEQRFQVDLTLKKAYIGHAVEALLAGQMQ